MAPLKDTRKLLKNSYPSKQWGKEVDKMSSSQLIAAFMQLKNNQSKEQK